MPDVDEALVKQYTDNINIQVQQKGSRLRKWCNYDTITGESKSVDHLGPTEAQELEGRHADTPLTDPSHERRWITPTPKVVAHLLDGPDQVRMLENPTSKYVMNQAFAIGRSQDRAIIKAANATVKSGKEGQSTTAFPAGNTIPVNYVESGSPANSKLTVGKVRRVKALVTDAMVDDTEPMVWVCTSFEIQDLLQDPEVTSADYNTIKALVNGEINYWMGFNWQQVSSKLLPYTGATDIRTNFAWAKSGMTFAETEAMMMRITERADKNYATQVYARGDHGAVRMEEPLVYEILCDRSP